MAEVTVRITRLLSDIAGAGPEIAVEASTAAEALDALCDEIPALRVHIFDDRGDVRRHVGVFVDGTAARDRAGLDQALADGGEVAVIQAVSGG